MPNKTVNMKRLLRQIHYWLSLAVMLPSGIIIAAGIFLMLKKEIGWIQPPIQKGSVIWEMPDVIYTEMLTAFSQHPEAGIKEWTDIKRIDIRPKFGLAKVTSNTGWEIQLDTANGDILSVAYRRSDMIEAIHDGSFFADWVKFYIFLPAGILLLIMWGTGIYLFLLPQFAKAKKSGRKKFLN